MRRIGMTLLSLWLLAALSPFSHADSSASVGISAIVPVVCAVTEQSRQVRRGDDDDDDGLIITVVLSDNCNAVHRLRVLYLPANLLRDEDRLRVTLNNVLPNISIPGERSFTDLPPGVALRTLRIRYTTESDRRRRAFVSGLGFGVSAP